MTRRLVLSYLAITVLVLLLLQLPLAIFYQQREVDRLTADVERDATVMATIYEDVLQNGFIADPTPAADYKQATGGRVIIVDADGISIVDSDREVDRDYSTRPEVAAALGGERSSGTRRSDTLDTELLFVAVPVASGGEVHGAVRITLDAHEVNERVQRFWLGLVAVAAVILLAVAGLGWVLAGTVTRPVRRLQAAAQRFSLGDLTPIEADSAAPPELATLETGLNDMAARLHDLIERQRSFVSDASHQLRTPLTALRLRLENLQSATPSQAMADELADAIEETTRLSTLVNDLLLLARTENRQVPVPVDLTRLVADRVSTWSATADMADVDLTLSGDDAALTASALRGGVEQVLDNLIDNALRVSPPASTVSVRLATRGDRHVVTVADDGPGLSDEDKRHALQRFWRSDTSTPGTGLGLAIAQTIIEASGGTLQLDDHHRTSDGLSLDASPTTRHATDQPRGLIATFTLPAATPAPGPTRREAAGTTTA